MRMRRSYDVTDLAWVRDVLRPVSEQQPRPSVSLAVLLREGLPPLDHSTADKGDLLVTAASNVPVSAQQKSALPKWSRKMINWISGLGAAAKIGLGTAVAAASISTAGVAQALPGDVQEAFNSAVSAATPFDISGDDDGSLQVGDMECSFDSSHDSSSDGTSADASSDASMDCSGPSGDTSTDFSSDTTGEDSSTDTSTDFSSDITGEDSSTDTSTGSSADDADDAADDAAEDARERAEEDAEEARERAEEAREVEEEKAEARREAAEEARDRAEDDAEEAQDAAEDRASDEADAAEEAAEASSDDE